MWAIINYAAMVEINENGNYLLCSLHCTMNIYHFGSKSLNRKDFLFHSLKKGAFSGKEFKTIRSQNLFNMGIQFLH